MTAFGESLRKLRQMCRDPHQDRALSQARLGELIGHEMQDRGFSGAAVSDWERGKSRINADDRNVLIALLKVLYRCGGLRTERDANQLLEAGNYRALNKEEAQAVFGVISVGSGVEQPIDEREISRPPVSLLLEHLLSLSENETRSMLEDTRKGPPPAWPRLLAAFIRKASERSSVSPRIVPWIWVWLLGWWLIAPSLRWPFADRDATLVAVETYIAGTLAIPLLIGMLVDTKNSEYWKQQGLANSKLLRLYTYQGAGIGFNLGYFFVFPLVLIRYYLDFESSRWLEFTAVMLGLILGNMSARVVPHNLWLAYKRLHLADGAIFFVAALLGPLWGLFFLQYHSILLTSFVGSMIILLAFTIFMIVSMRQSNRIDTKRK